MNITECPNDLCRHHHDCSNECYECGVLTVKDNWASVEDRLPEIGTNIIAFCFEDHIQEAWHERVDTYDDGDVPIFKSNVTSRYLTVTHWQPLPALPEDEE